MPGRKRKDKITQENYETLERKKNTSMNLLSILKISIQRSYYSKFLGNLTSSCHNISPPSFYWQLYLLKNILFCFYLYLFEHFDTVFRLYWYQLYNCAIMHCVKSVLIRSYFWSLLSCIQFEYRKIRTRNNSIFGHFSRNDIVWYWRTYLICLRKRLQVLLKTQTSELSWFALQMNGPVSIWYGPPSWKG